MLLNVYEDAHRHHIPLHHTTYKLRVKNGVIVNFFPVGFFVLAPMAKHVQVTLGRSERLCSNVVNLFLRLLHLQKPVDSYAGSEYYKQQTSSRVGFPLGNSSQS